ncbi:hypothetical protein APX70_00096 [Pseudomonas syringae pv. maculicola]|uniref:Uncharacterized protein n=1 Tax=Pseudomonas syringae pv. maculicola TaxID=59511 RepID=A0A3M2ZX63_PSEYM|nr:gamma-mobile-trio protein GmtX [Pseudomonas syringae group genomosp. 3]KKI25037.1 hypothetical protein WX98_16280 [Pseudomonas syringae pv. persicae]RML92826.1 hypothetical protein APX70_00096 [Pseudomonas syringae pv. maculicola]
MNEKVNPEGVFCRLMDQATDLRRKRSLQAIHDICKLLHERQSLDFSLRNITLLGHDRQLAVPSIKSISNSTGLHYRELIHAWKNFSAKVDEQDQAADNWINAIPDPVLRMSVMILSKELKALRAKNSRKENSVPGTIIITSTGGQPVNVGQRLNDAERAALRASIDPHTLRLVGLNIGVRGEITDQAGRFIHKPGYCDAIRKLLGAGAENIGETS